MNHPTVNEHKLRILGASLDGELYHDALMRSLYATDASVYREMPMAVAFPRHAEDLLQLIQFARKEHVALIPRAAGTSLAGQVVGHGMVVDTGRHMNKVLELNAEAGWVRVQPGVVRDELNRFLQPHGLFFGPNTSTANRAMIGGMVGNNSCGSYSIVYGSTRDHVLELKGLLSDGSEVVFGPLSREQFEEKCRLSTLEGELYRNIIALLSPAAVQAEIRAQFPKAGITRRNTGYALDELLNSERFTPRGPAFNFARLLCGSEGTLCLLTEIKLQCVPLPPPVTGLMCAHFDSVTSSLEAVVIGMKRQPRAAELMDKIILECTEGNALFSSYRFFVEGKPGAILVFEFGGQNREEVEAALDRLEKDFRDAGLGYAFPRVFGAEQIKKVWKLREAGLGLLSNMPGDAKPVAVIEDTAVLLEELPAYIADFDKMLRGYGQQAVYYAHAGAGEIHLRPILNLKSPEDRVLFRQIAHDSAALVKSYGGSLSGEHGDGRLRAEFIPLVMGEQVYRLFKRLKQAWDPQGIFNPGKIVDAPPMDTSLRYDAGQTPPEPKTLLNFDETQGLLRMAEKCNGTAECRKTHKAGGVMCPSYMATLDERDSTRARANALREFLTHSHKKNRFDHEELHEVMDLCLSCKGCLSECPSNVDVASMKAEFLHQYYKSQGVPLRAKIFANYHDLSRFGALLPRLSNTMLKGGAGNLLRKVAGIAPKRSLPLFSPMSLRKWYAKAQASLKVSGERRGKLYLFCDEFTEFNEAHIGVKTLQLLSRLGYEVELIAHPESGRAAISKGLLPKAKRLAEANVKLFAPLISEKTPLIGIEPSAILGFRDEYPRLVDRDLAPQARELAKHCLLVDEFLAAEARKGNITPEMFSDAPRQVFLHGHCHQKALSDVGHTAYLLALPKNYRVENIPSGCCGMAGSFGYEAEHYEVSMKIGELVLLPAVRQAPAEALIAAPGTSCRHQIWDGAGRKALHPVEILLDALKGKTQNGKAV